MAVLYVPYLLDTNLETLAPKDPLSSRLLADTFAIQVPLPTHMSEVPLYAASEPRGNNLKCFKDFT